METKRTNLHMDKKRACIIMLSFVLILTLVDVFVTLSVGKDFSQLSSLLRSDYVYSAIINESASQDSYYQFDAGISFSVTADAKSSINAAILMQSKYTQYTESVDWNADTFSKNNVAITGGLARQYGLKVGDRLYSEHIVDGAVYDYVIKQILPDISSIRSKNERSFTDGVIIMGDDEQYIKNISHSSIIYTKMPVEDLASSLSDMPVSIVYRTEEIAAVTRKIIPYLILFLLLSILIFFGLVTIVTREVQYNVKRMIMLGFDKKRMDASFRGLIYGIGFPVIIVAFILSMVVALLSGFSFIEGAFYLVQLGVEIVTVLFARYAYTKRLWR